MVNNLLIFPTEKEALSVFPNIRLELNRFSILEANSSDNKIVICGISKSNASLNSWILFNEYMFKKSFLVGICGCYRGCGIGVGDVVSVRFDYFADEGVLKPDGSFDSLYKLGFKINSGNKSLFDVVNDTKIVDSNTVSLISGSNHLADIYRYTDASIENMEGAAVGLAAEKAGRKISQIRAVSNYCGDRDTQGWDIKLAFNKLREFVNEKIIVQQH